MLRKTPSKEPQAKKLNCKQETYYKQRIASITQNIWPRRLFMSSSFRVVHCPGNFRPQTIRFTLITQGISVCHAMWLATWAFRSVVRGMRWTGLPDRNIDQIGEKCLKIVKNLSFWGLGEYLDTFFRGKTWAIAFRRIFLNSAILLNSGCFPWKI